MSNDILGKMGPTFDLSRTINLASSVQAQFDESQRETRRIAEEAYNNRQKCNGRWSKLRKTQVKQMHNYKK